MGQVHSFIHPWGVIVFIWNNRSLAVKWKAFWKHMQEMVTGLAVDGSKSTQVDEEPYSGRKYKKMDRKWDRSRCSWRRIDRLWDEWVDQTRVITPPSLHPSSVFKRLVTLIADHARVTAAGEASLAQAKSATEAARRLMTNPEEDREDSSDVSRHLSIIHVLSIVWSLRTYQYTPFLSSPDSPVMPSRLPHFHNTLLPKEWNCLHLYLWEDSPIGI